MHRRTALALSATLALLLGLAAPAASQSSSPVAGESFSALMAPLNNSDVTGTSKITRVGNSQIRVQVTLEGLAPGLPHAMHIHGSLDGSADSVCPTPSADSNGDGLISTPEGIPSYGGILVSLTTSGDTSPESTLAVDRFPTAANGTIDYDRVIDVDPAVAARLADLHVVSHGIDLDRSGGYNGRPSPLNSSVPFEATIPNSCGELSPVMANATAFEASLNALNNSGVNGWATVVRQGNTINVSVNATGLLPNAPHAMHIHGMIEGVADRCPPPSADTNGDGLISTPEGQPFYGEILVSLTTTGDTSPSSSLAVDRFPTASNGSLVYNRTFTVDPAVANQVSEFQIVVHGIDLNNSGGYDGPPSPLSSAVPFEATIPNTCGSLSPAATDALWLVGADGGVFALGSAGFSGSLGANPPPTPAVDVAVTPSRNGYWFATADGGVFSFGGARFFGSAAGGSQRSQVTGITGTATGAGYWLVTERGEVRAFGDAATFGDASSINLRSPIVDLTPTPSGQGYWLVAADGGVFAYGDARFFGSAAALPLNKPIIGIMSSTQGDGYMLFAADGGVFAYGNVQFRGSTGGISLDSPAVDVTATPSGQGYWVVTADGMVYAFGDADPVGSIAGLRLNAPIVGAAS